MSYIHKQSTGLNLAEWSEPNQYAMALAEQQQEMSRRRLRQVEGWLAVIALNAYCWLLTSYYVKHFLK